MQLSSIIAALEDLAPSSLQESYDNAGLITGHEQQDITGILVCLDSTEAIIDEAIHKGCNLIVAHHPIVFSGIKKLNGKNYVERTIIKAIKNEIAIYAIHTNLDNVMNGVNRKIAETLGLENLKILSPTAGKLKKLVTYVPHAQLEEVRDALFTAGAGTLGNYDQCSFNLEGSGTFRAGVNANPYVGKIGERHTENETRIEVIFEDWKENQILKALKTNHPYEEIAFDIYSLNNSHLQIGAGMIGELNEPISTPDFLNQLKIRMNAQGIRHTKAIQPFIKKVAVCGGSGSFLLKNAIAAGADVFVTSDFKYHQFFDADDKILIADIGHFESEQFTIDLIGAYLREKFTKFAVHLTELNTNPINYY
ncbi:Nif3-like dinuclear metal center hexameric protein [soil metagenome]